MLIEFVAAVAAVVENMLLLLPLLSIVLVVADASAGDISDVVNLM